MPGVGFSTYTGANATVVRAGTPPVTTFTRTAANPAALSPAGLGYPGLRTYLVRVMARKTSGGAPGAAWVGELTYATAGGGGHAIDPTSYKKTIAAPVGYALGALVPLEFDMSALGGFGGTDWLTSEIDQIQLKLDNDNPSVWVLESIAFGVGFGFEQTPGELARHDTLSPTNAPDLVEPRALGSAHLNAHSLGANVVDLSMEAGNTATLIQVSFDQVTMVNSAGEPVTIGQVTGSLDTGNTIGGVDALDTGSWAANTWYAVYAISDGTNCHLLASTSYTSGPAALPGAYAYWCRLGWVRTLGTATNFLHTLQIRDLVRIVISGTALPVMASGAAGNVSISSTSDWVAVATGAFVPPTAHTARVLLASTTGQAIVAPNMFYGNASSTTAPPLLRCSADLKDGEIPLESTNIYWASTVAGNRLLSTGWRDRG